MSKDLLAVEESLKKININETKDLNNSIFEDAAIICALPETLVYKNTTGELEINNNNLNEEINHNYINLDRSMKNLTNIRLDLNASSNSNKLANSTNSNQDENDQMIPVKTQVLNHPKYAQYFKKRVCIKFVSDSKTKLCVGCQQPVNHGAHKYQGTEWNYQTCTTLMPTDSYGKLTFPGSHSKTASYIRVQNETKTKEMIQYLYSPEGWNLQRPQLILSVTGGEQDFMMPYRMKKAFKRGLIKAAASTGAWIITGGTNTGVMRLVGEAVADEFHASSLTVLGIATWGKIAFRDQMVKKTDLNRSTTQHLDEMAKEAQQLPLFYAPQETDLNENKKDQSKNTDVLLDANHTHFVFVDDGSEGQFGKEIEFRAHLEAELRKGRSLKYYESKRNQKDEDSDDLQDEDNVRNETVPIILIVVQGGPNTLITVEESLKQAVPVLVLADSKGCADLIANACSIPNKKDSYLEKLIAESKMFETFTKDEEVYKKKISEAMNRLKYIISKLFSQLYISNCQAADSDISNDIFNLINKKQSVQPLSVLKEKDVKLSDLYEIYFDLPTPRPHFIIKTKKNGIKLNTDISLFDESQSLSLFRSFHNFIDENKYHQKEVIFSYHTGKWASDKNSFHAHICIDLKEFLENLKRRNPFLENFKPTNQWKLKPRNNQSIKDCYIENVKNYENINGQSCIAYQKDEIIKIKNKNNKSSNNESYMNIQFDEIEPKIKFMPDTELNNNQPGPITTSNALLKKMIEFAKNKRIYEKGSHICVVYGPNSQHYGYLHLSADDYYSIAPNRDIFLKNFENLKNYYIKT